MPEQSPTRFTMVPARRSDEPTARKRARRILATLFLASGLSVVAVVVALVKGNAEPDLSNVNPQGRDLAYTAALTFLAGEQQQVPHAEDFDPEDALYDEGGRVVPLDYRSLNWVGFTPQHFGSEELGFTDFEIHHFLVVLRSPGQVPPEFPTASTSPSPRSRSSVAAAPGSPSPESPSPGGSQSAPPGPSAAPTPTPSSTEDGGAQLSNVVQLDVPVLLDSTGPRLAASPTFSVWKKGTGEPSGRGDYSNYTGLTVNVSDEAKNQILRWAAAYASGDSAGLLAVTGDQDTSHRYQGLSGFALSDSRSAVQILSAIRGAEGRIIVRVRLLLARTQQPGTVPGREGNRRPFTTYADFDLLVGDSGAQPPVLAWGPAGSAAELEPYYNALSN